MIFAQWQKGEPVTVFPTDLGARQTLLADRVEDIASVASVRPHGSRQGPVILAIPKTTATYDETADP